MKATIALLGALMFFGYVIVQTLRQQGDLRPSLTFNKSLHDRPRYDLDERRLDKPRPFHPVWFESASWWRRLKDHRLRVIPEASTNRSSPMPNPAPSR